MSALDDIKGNYMLPEYARSKTGALLAIEEHLSELVDQNERIATCVEILAGAFIGYIAGLSPDKSVAREAYEQWLKHMTSRKNG